jgi:hypothetical protein
MHSHDNSIIKGNIMHIDMSYWISASQNKII